MRAVIFDIDGTLSDPAHRLHHVTGSQRDWNAFFAAMGDDGLHAEVLELLLRLEDHYPILLCSGRPDDYQEATEAWLDHYEVPRSAIYMRPAGDFRPDHEVKRQLLRGMRADGYDPWLVVDDRPSVVAMWRAEGLTCLQCRDWNEERATARPTILTLMVGPTAAGKTTWLTDTENLTRYSIHPSHVVSSDQLRTDICGDFHDQTQNDAVFAALHASVRARLAHGLPTVVDATNLRNRDRRAVAALAPEGTRVRYVVLDRPEAEKRATAGWRADLPFDLIAKHTQIFRSNLRDVLAGDGNPNVEIIDLRRT